MGTVIDRVLRAEGLVLQEAMELDSSEVIVGMVSHGLGAAVVPSAVRLRNALSDIVNTLPFGTSAHKQARGAGRKRTGEHRRGARTDWCMTS